MPSIKDKRLYSNYWLETVCPACDDWMTMDFTQSPMFYVPEEYPHVHWYCDNCHTDGLILQLVEINEIYAVVERHPNFSSEHQINVMRNEPVLDKTL